MEALGRAAQLLSHLPQWVVLSVYLGAVLTNSKLHKGLVVFSQHIEEQIQDLKLPEVLVVLGVIGKVGEVGQHLLLGLCKGEASREGGERYQRHLPRAT